MADLPGHRCQAAVLPQGERTAGRSMGAAWYPRQLGPGSALGATTKWPARCQLGLRSPSRMWMPGYSRASRSATNCWKCWSIRGSSRSWLLTANRVSQGFLGFGPRGRASGTMLALGNLRCLRNTTEFSYQINGVAVSDFVTPSWFGAAGNQCSISWVIARKRSSY